jgi:hypothetical protein
MLKAKQGERMSERRELYRSPNRDASDGLATERERAALPVADYPKPWMTAVVKN